MPQKNILTPNDIQTIESIFDLKFEKNAKHIIDAVFKMIDPMYADIQVIKSDVAVLKTDVAVLKTDVAVLKTDVSILKVDVSYLKDDLHSFKSYVHTTQDIQNSRLTHLELNSPALVSGSNLSRES